MTDKTSKIKSSSPVTGSSSQSKPAKFILVLVTMVVVLAAATVGGYYYLSHQIDRHVEELNAFLTFHLPGAQVTYKSKSPEVFSKAIRFEGLDVTYQGQTVFAADAVRFSDIRSKNPEHIEFHVDAQSFFYDFKSFIQAHKEVVQNSQKELIEDTLDAFPEMRSTLAELRMDFNLDTANDIFHIANFYGLDNEIRLGELQRVLEFDALTIESKFTDTFNGEGTFNLNNFTAYDKGYLEDAEYADLEFVLYSIDDGAQYGFEKFALHLGNEKGATEEAFSFDSMDISSNVSFKEYFEDPKALKLKNDLPIPTDQSLMVSGFKFKIPDLENTKVFKDAGYDFLTGNLNSSSKINPQEKAMNWGFKIVFDQMGEFSLGLNLSNMDFEPPQSTLLTSEEVATQIEKKARKLITDPPTLVSGNFLLIDQPARQRILAQAARMDKGLSLEAQLLFYGQMISVLTAHEEDPNVRKVAGELKDFIINGGRLEASVKPKNPVPLDQLSDLGKLDYSEQIDFFNLKLDHTPATIN